MIDRSVTVNRPESGSATASRPFALAAERRTIWLHSQTQEDPQFRQHCPDRTPTNDEIARHACDGCGPPLELPLPELRPSSRLVDEQRGLPWRYPDLAYWHYAQRAGVSCASYLPERNLDKLGDVEADPEPPVYALSCAYADLSAAAKKAEAEDRPPPGTPPARSREDTI